MTENSALARLAALQELIAALMPAGRREARMPDAVASGLAAAGLFKLWVPRQYGGSQLSLPQALKVYEAAAGLDGAVGWAVMIGSGGGLFAAYLPEAAARALFAPPDALVAGSGAPTGTARRVPGGYRAGGRWRYASGAHYATVFTANCRVLEADGQPPADESASIRAMSFAASAVRIRPTWNTSGLRATGSHDFEVDDVFVPEEFTFSVLGGASPEASDLYQLPFDTLTQLPVSAVVLGIATHALALFCELAAAKPAPGSSRRLLQLEPVAQAIRNAQSLIDAARTLLYELAERAWCEVQDGGQATEATVEECTRHSAALVRSLVEGVATLVPYAGMNAISLEDDFAVAWRDLEAAAAHYAVSPLHGGPSAIAS